jgi:hypothetical protein
MLKCLSRMDFAKTWLQINGRSPFDSPRSTRIRSGQALRPLVKARAFGMTQGLG